jgi:hypothetical protein
MADWLIVTLIVAGVVAVAVVFAWAAAGLVFGGIAEAAVIAAKEAAESPRHGGRE